MATLIGAATAVVIALMARELGGSRPTQVAAAAIAAGSSLTLVTTHMLATNSMDTLLWVLAGLFALRLFRTGEPRWWLAIGAVAGSGWRTSG